MKTISELNNKWWYRLVKVFYILGLLFTVALTVGIIWEENQPILVNDFLVHCKNTGATTKATDLDLYITDSEYYSERYYSTLTEEHKTKIKEFCDISADDVESIHKKMEASIPTFEKNNPNATLAETQKYIDGFAPYTVEPTAYYNSTYTRAILTAVVGLIINIVVFEIGRRVFYYVVFGRFFPVNKS